LRAVPVAPPAGVDYRVLSPIRPLPVKTFDFNRDATLESFAIGAESAMAFAERHRSFLTQSPITDHSSR
jgi:hypothetical protein